ncbi:hypothetical protein E3U43_002568 [Larimichthys crocea]|uniref:Uncharacterized protein n=1 Tax=Larimichthys crocea TaxID=215358 RepID=A0ACD3QSS1_LARCR|nr:hypothetical protein E3U43_002568 [Larimichthys crocea]
MTDICDVRGGQLWHMMNFTDYENYAEIQRFVLLYYVSLSVFCELFVCLSVCSECFPSGLLHVGLYTRFKCGIKGLLPEDVGEQCLNDSSMLEKNSRIVSEPRAEQNDSS